MKRSRNSYNKSGLVGQRVRLTPHAWGRLGEPMAALDGHRLFVFGAIPGEECVAEVFQERRGYLAARVVETPEPSPHRVAAPCPYFGPCTGCQWQHVDYDEQLRVKTEAVRDALRRVGGFRNAAVDDCLPSARRFGYRNHARFTVDKDGSLGFVNRESRRMTPVDSCMIMDPGVNRILGELQGRCAETTQLSIRYGVNTGGYLVQPTLKTAEVEIKTGQTHYTESVRGRDFRVASPSFFQVNIPQMERLVDLAREGLALTGAETLVDAYAGVGAFALLLAPYAKSVVAIEDSPAAVEDAKANAAGVDNVTFLLGRTEALLAGMDPPPDGVIMDPPRKGCHPSALEALKKLRPPRVVYVSCDPATLARDLKVLCADVFRLERTRPVDMFPQTHHVECVATLALRRPMQGFTLASSSPRRRELAAGLGVEIKALSPGVDEGAVDGETPEEAVQRLALAKARAGAARSTSGPVIGADTLVVIEGRPLGKPQSEADAASMLRSLRGRVHTVMTGVAVVDAAEGREVVSLSQTAVTMREYTDDEIGRYVESGRAMDKAGAYGVQDAEFSPAAGVDGCFANVVGLPLCAVSELLHDAGYDVSPLALPPECRSHAEEGDEPQ